MSNYNFITLPQWICSSFFATYADFDGPRFTDTRLIRTPFLLRTLCFFPREKSPFIFSQQAISEFPPSLCIKTRLSAQPLIWKWFFILMQIKLIFTRKFVHLASFWKWGFLELGSGLFNPLNPLSPSSDQDQFSPNKIHTLSRDKLWELIKWSPERNALIYHQILSTNSLRKCMEISWRICMWILGLKGLIYTDTFCGPLSVHINGLWLYLCRYWWVPVSRCLWSHFCL